MKEEIQKSLQDIISGLYDNPELNTDLYVVHIQDNKDKEHGDLASNIALVLSKPLKKNPKEIANEIIEQFSLDANICLLYTSPSPRDATLSRMPSSA